MNKVGFAFEISLIFFDFFELFFKTIFPFSGGIGVVPARRARDWGEIHNPFRGRSVPPRMWTEQPPRMWTEQTPENVDEQTPENVDGATPENVDGANPRECGRSKP